MSTPLHKGCDVFLGCAACAWQDGFATAQRQMREVKMKEPQSERVTVHTMWALVASIALVVAGAVTITWLLAG